MRQVIDASIAPESTADAPDFLEGFIDEDEYARIRRVTRRTCQRDRQRRQAPPHTQLGRRILYRVDAVREWLVRNERNDRVTARKALTARSSRTSYRTAT